MSKRGGGANFIAFLCLEKGGVTLLVKGGCQPRVIIIPIFGGGRAGSKAVRGF